MVQSSGSMTPPMLVTAALLGLLAPACCVAPPRTEEWLTVGWKSPRQAFATFQTAIRADSAELEYRCFSTGFRERNGISKLGWREARAELRRQHPWLRKGISDARLESDPVQNGPRARAVAASHGQRIALGFVREDFAELWQGDTLVLDEGIDFERATLEQRGADGRRWFQASLALPSGDETEHDWSEMRIGREWKIDSFEVLDASPEALDPRAKVPPLEEDLD